MTVELTTGKELVGRLRRFDRFALILEVEGEELLVYKHAIATVHAGPPEATAEE